jgi:type IV secretory pathway protease TraF
VIPSNTYLLLGDQANGSVDASVFGLVDKSDIIGKAIILEK